MSPSTPTSRNAPREPSPVDEPQGPHQGADAPPTHHHPSGSDQPGHDGRSPVDDRGAAGPVAAGLSGVWERLIEVAARGAFAARCSDVGRIRTWDELGSIGQRQYLRLTGDVLAAVLPLIADEILAHSRPLPDYYGIGAAEAADLVRSWAADGAR